MNSLLSNTDFKDLSVKGLWQNNPALVQLLGLCPLLAVSNNFVNALGMGLATIVVLTGSNIAVSLIRHYLTDSVRLPIFVMIIASLTTCVQLIMQAFAFELYETLGIFIPLIVTNCIIIGRAEAYASRNNLLNATFDGLAMGLGFMLVLLTLGAIREILGQGTLFSGLELLLGENFSSWKIVLFESQSYFLFAILPPGAFVGLGVLVAAKRQIDEMIKRHKDKSKKLIPKGSKRIRTTGQIS